MRFLIQRSTFGVSRPFAGSRLKAGRCSTFVRLLITVYCLLITSAAFAVAPTVTNVEAHQWQDASRKVEINYTLADPDSETVFISVTISNDGGSTYSITPAHVTGDTGWVRPGGRRTIIWDAKADYPTAVWSSCKAKVTADDSSGGVYPGQMIYVPAGSFLMGNSGVGDDGVYPWCEELPQHWVSLSGYWIGKYEVTRGEYRAFMTATGRAQPNYWDAVQDWGTGSFIQTDNHPVVGVTWYDAEAFCNWAGGHLATEAQWEKAARWTGSHPNVYPWGDAWDAEKCNNYYDHNPAGGGYQKWQTAPVGSYPMGMSPYGLHDMAGNVWEWVQDWYITYPGSTCPADYTGSYRVKRGGSWFFYLDGLDRCAFRFCRGPLGSWYDLGFRIAR